MTDNFDLFDRRRFFSTAAAGGIVLHSGVPKAFAADVAPVAADYAGQEYDLIVIGGGTAGIPCAIMAAENGAKVLLIEKSIQLGGSLWLSGGSMAAAGTRLQARKGIKDTPEIFYQDIMRLSEKTADPGVVRRYVEQARIMADWLEDLGFQVREGEPVMGRGGHASFSMPRYFQGPEKGRSILHTLFPVLRKHVLSKQVNVLFSTDPAELVLKSDESVSGVITTNEKGIRTQFNGRKVVITSGGYCHSPEMFERVTGFKARAKTSYFMSKGEGLLLGEAAGGYIRGGEYQILGPGSILNDRNFPSKFVYQPELNYERRPVWEIRVNLNGERFLQEDNPDLDARDYAFTHQPTQRMWLIFDQEILDRAPSLINGRSKEEILPLYGNHPMFFKETSLDALARRTGINAANLAKTVSDYNAGVVAQKDPLGKQFLPCGITKGPFYAVEITGGNIIGFGGLAVDPDMRVLRKSGKPIANLYAAGEVIGLATICGKNVISGSGVTPSLTFGRMIGANIRQS